MKATYSHLEGLAIATLVVLLKLAAGHGEMTLTAGGYGPSSSSAGPRITWTPPTVNATGTFTLISAPFNNSAMKYVSFAFSNGTHMVDAYTVVDCYEINGEVKLATSKNVLGDGHAMNNSNDPPSLSQVQLLSANKSAGVLTCSFTMKFMSTLEVNVMLAFGDLATGATASSPTKLRHDPKSRFASANTIGQVLAASNMTSAPSVTSSTPKIMSSTPNSQATTTGWSCGLLLPFVIVAMKMHLL